MTDVLTSGERKIGRFLRRLNRFAVEVELDGRVVLAHLPNSGRMSELLTSGRPALLISRTESGRRTHYDMMMVQVGDRWVSVDSRLPNKLFHAALLNAQLPQFAGYDKIRREASFEGSRLDFALSGPGGVCFVETKSVNLVCDGLALFPDAPTIRGVRHLHALCKARSGGMEAAVVFVVQRDDAKAFSPYDDADPHFGHMLRAASDAGVGVYAYYCAVTPEGVKIAGELKVLL